MQIKKIAKLLLRIWKYNTLSSTILMYHHIKEDLEKTHSLVLNYEKFK